MGKGINIEYYVSEDITLKDFAKNNGIPYKTIKEINPGIDENESLQGRIIQYPKVTELTDTNAEVNIFEPYLKIIRPLLMETADLIRKFNKNAFSVFTKNRENGIAVFTHINFRDSSFIKKNAELVYVRGIITDNRKFQLKIIDKYYDTQKSFFEYIMHMIHVYHFVMHMDNKKSIIFNKDIKDIIKVLEYLPFYLRGVLTKLSDIFEAINSYYEMLNGSFMDYLYYKNISDLLDEVVPLLKDFYSAKDDKNPKPHWQKKEAYLIDFTAETFNGALIKLKDEDLFDFSKSFSNKIESDLKSKLKDGFANAFKKMQDNYSNDFCIATNLFWKEYIYLNNEEIRQLHAEVRLFIDEHKSLNKKFSEEVIFFFYRNIQADVSTLLMALDNTTTNDHKLEQKIKKLSYLIQIYKSAIAVYSIACTADNIPWLQKLFEDEEAAVEKGKDLMSELYRISSIRDLDTQEKELQLFYEKYNKLQEEVKVIAGNSKKYTRITDAIILVGAIALLAAVTYFTAGLGTAGLLTAYGSGGAALGAGTLTTGQTVFCLFASAYATSLIFESTDALIEGRDIDALNVIEGTITCAMMSCVLGFTHSLVNNAFKTVTSQVTKTVLKAVFLIISNSIGTVIASAPGFMFRMGITGNGSWVDFIKINLLLGGILGTLESIPAFGSLIKNKLIESKENELRKLLAECKNEYQNLTKNLSDFSFNYDKAALESEIQKHKTYLGKLKKAVKFAKQLRRLFIDVSNSMKQTVASESYETLAVLDYELDVSEKVLAKIPCIDSPAKVTSVVFDNNLPKGKGLVPISNSLMNGNVVAIDQYKDKLVASNSKTYQIEITGKMYPAQDSKSLGVAQVLIKDANTHEMTGTLTIFDVAGQGEIALKGYVDNAKLLPKKTVITDAVKIVPKLIHAQEEYTKLISLKPEEVKGKIFNALKKMKSSGEVEKELENLMNLNQNEREELREFINKSKLPLIVVRFDSPFPFAEPPISFVSDITELLTVRTKYDGFINVGYDIKACNDALSTNKIIRVFYIKDKNVLVPATDTNLQKGLDDIYARWKALKAGKTIKHTYGGSDNYWDDKIYKGNPKEYDFGMALKEFKDLSGIASENEAIEEMKNCISEINNPPFSDKYKVSEKYVGESGGASGRIEIVQKRIKLLERTGQKGTAEYKQLKKYEFMLQFQAGWLSAYGWWANNGYTLTPYGKKGFGEYFLLSKYDIKTNGIYNGYECANAKGIDPGYNMNDFYKEK